MLPFNYLCFNVLTWQWDLKYFSYVFYSKVRIEIFWKLDMSLVAQMVKNLPGLLETQVFHPWSGRSSKEGNGNTLQHSYLENSMDRGACWAIVHGVTKSCTWLSISTDLALATSWTSSLPIGAGLFQRIQCTKRGGERRRSHPVTRRVLWGAVWNGWL